MEDIGLDILAAVKDVTGRNKNCDITLKGYLEQQTWCGRARVAFLDKLTTLLLDPENTRDIASSFRPLALELLHRALTRPHSPMRVQVLDYVTHQRFCIALSHFIEICPETKGFIIEYLTSRPQFYRPDTTQLDEPAPKKQRWVINTLVASAVVVIHEANQLSPAWCVTIVYLIILKHLALSQPCHFPPAAGDFAAYKLAVAGFSKIYFNKMVYSETHSEPPKRRDLIKAVHVLVTKLGCELRDSWDWSDFLPFLRVKDLQTRWFAVNTVSLLVGMSAKQLEIFKCKHFTAKQERQFLLKFQSNFQSEESARLLSNPVETEGNRLTKQSERVLTSYDLCEPVVSVCGVLLSKLPESVDKENELDLLVGVATTRRNLRRLALAVASQSPALLQGPVGSGKTTLVEQLARLTGRNKPPNLMKIQLGDQTDSKALLGTYRCTDIPGEFVWQAGALTQAVTEGHWVLLEDLDYAPMDVITVLVGLLERHTLLLPGHGDQIRAHPNFRLFATRRYLSSGSGWFKQHNTGADMLDKMWNKITVEPLSRAELQEVIVDKHPQLRSIVERLLDVYFLLSAGRHDLSGVAMETEESDDVGKFLTRDGRLISTRDLMKWCERVSGDFQENQVATGALVFQEAIDCFCMCLAKPEKRIPLAEAIGAKLNITHEKASYYCTKHKPNVEVTTSFFSVGRVELSRKSQQHARLQNFQSSSFAYTRQAVSLLETVSVCVERNEPVLLVGETGTGKTSSVQYLAQQIGCSLRVINMSQQSDTTDLLGGFKPIDLRFIVAPFREDFEMLFCKTFSVKENDKFLGHIQECFSARRWVALFKLMDHVQKTALKMYKEGTENHNSWNAIGRKLHQLKSQVRQAESALAFSFIEGSLIQALKKGDWVLLDEINLTTAETLECLSGLLESTTGSVVLTERGDTEPVVRHEDFRLFACMNPATDVGKKDLPPGVRNRFTEVFVDELEDVQDLKILVAEYLKGLSLPANQIVGIVKFYLTVRTETVKRLTDGTGNRPHYSLRTLCRALSLAAGNIYGSVQRSLYESFCLSFLTQLDRSSHPIVEQLVRQHVIGQQNVKRLLRQPLSRPPDGTHLQFEGYWLATGSRDPLVPINYVLTPSVRANLKDLARIVSAGRYPVLLQGETSVGKTSLIHWLAQSTGNVCVRINNHEHTDIQEYVGCYATNQTGKLYFKEGVLVEAMRKGYWIILDELNLAPTDVLEALNRLLDDNRELFIPETQEMVKAHRRFMLFATQNPPGQYAGRKVLSRAFRNRFVELHFDEIPSKELETILHERCSLPFSYCQKLVAVLLELQMRRRGSGVFAGKQGFITLRDLFRWAERYHLATHDTEDYFDWDQQLADNGYMLLAGRVRKPDECHVIQEVIEKHIKRKVDPEKLFTLSDKTSPTTAPILKQVTVAPPTEFKHIVWTSGLRRMAVLVGQALKFGEPVLLVGDTGCGKTTICQLFAALGDQKLHSVNCHLHTETADFLGGLRPVRHREQEGEQKKLFEWCDGPLVQAMREGSLFLMDEISLADDSVLERLNSVLEPERTLLLAEKGGGDGGQNEVDQIVADPTFRVLATMNPGGDYGKKELSPALRNRFTEIWCPLSQDRHDMVSIIEHNLTPTVSLGNQEDGSSGFGKAIMNFVSWLSNNDLAKRMTVSIRDLLSWVQFINATGKSSDDDDTMMEPEIGSHIKLDPSAAYFHGACMVFLDALGSGITSGSSRGSHLAARDLCVEFLLNQIKTLTGHDVDLGSLGILDDRASDQDSDSKDDIESDSEDDYEDIQKTETRPNVVSSSKEHFGIVPFYIEKGPLSDRELQSYALNAPTTSMNAQRLLRALQLPRAMLLEGSPGVGKTSLVAAIAKAAGHELVRINLSEQTDVTDLFGADLPVEGGTGGQFVWRDGPLLRALKAGHWVVLDELNLASQSVLEGLNACLDHRAEVFVPELGTTFHVQPGKTRIFACQNPLCQGGGRKGLPRSFLNRFTQVYVEPLSRADLLFITSELYPQLPRKLLSRMVDFNNKVHNETMVERQWGQNGSPWEFNLRDIFRWCDLLVNNQTEDHYDPGEYVGLVYSDRMRTTEDKSHVYATYSDVVVDDDCVYEFTGQYSITTNMLQVGHSFLPRSTEVLPTSGHYTPDCLQLLHGQLHPLESLMKCIEMNWMAILIGPEGSGKTSLVHLLAQLTGKSLSVLPMNSSMDTTELLGGFEQADLGRHMESVVKRTEQTLYHALAQSLVAKHDSTAQAQTLFSHWSKYLTLSKKRGRSMTGSDEEVYLRRLIDELEKLITSIYEVINQTNASSSRTVLDELEDQTRKLGDIRSQLDNRRSTSVGGQFEWIDSVLVRALQEGHWLLIDNVNMCSASVLDRLNALLEPGGVLSINERGVIDGRIPTVRPHPQFRLILAMDPKHGEISRAMRNRGVEICLLRENETGTYSEQDIRQMLHGLGLVGKSPCETCVGLHTALQRAGVTRFSLTHLLQATRLTRTQLDRGIDFTTALKESFYEVYVRGHLNMADRLTLSRVIDEKLHPLDLIGQEAQTGNSCLLEAGLWPDPLPDLHDWIHSVSMATVRKGSSLFLHLLNQISLHATSTSDQPLTLSELCCKSRPAPSEISQTQLPELLRQLRVAAVVMLESCTAQHWQLLASWISSVIEKRLPPAAAASVLESEALPEVTFVRGLPSILVESLEAVFSNPLLKEAEVVLRRILRSQDLELLKEQPYDLQWNKLMMEHLIKKCIRQDGDTINQEIQLVYNVFNQLNLVSRVAQQKRVHEVALDTQDNRSRKKNTSLLHISAAHYRGDVMTESLPHPIVSHLYPFIYQLDRQLLAILTDFHNLSHTDIDQLGEGLLWYERFVDLCLKTMTNQAHADSFLPELSLHWNWLQKKLFARLPPGASLSADMRSTLSQLQNTLGVDDSRSRLFRKIRHHVGTPEPYNCRTNAERIVNARKFSEHMQVLPPTDTLQRSRLPSQLKLHFQRGSEVRHRLVTSMIPEDISQDGSTQELWLDKALMSRVPENLGNSGKMEDISKTNSFPETWQGQLLRTYGLENLENSGKIDKLTKPESSWVRLLAFYELLAVRTEHKLLGDVMSTHIDVDSSQCDVIRNIRCFHKFCIEQTTVSAFPLFLWRRLSEKSICFDKCQSEEFYSYFSRLQSSPGVFSVNTWLQWTDCTTEGLSVEQKPASTIGNGSGSLFSSLVSHTAFTLLTDAEIPGEDPKRVLSMSTSVPSNIPLGESQEKLRQLAEINAQLWKHASIWSSPEVDPRVCSKRLLSMSVRHFLTYLLLMPSCNRKQTPRLRQLLHPDYDNPDCSLVVQEIQTILNVPELEMIVPQYQELLACCLHSVLAIQRSPLHDETNLDAGGDTWRSVSQLGEAWVYFGMLQSLLLAPQGPVDPAYKKAVKLDYSKRENDDLQLEQEVRDWQSQILTSNNSDAGNTKYLHPRIEYLQTRTEKLDNLIRRNSRETAYRPTPSQFSSILREVRQYTDTLGSYERVTQLVQSLKLGLEQAYSVDKATESGNPCVAQQKAWNNTAGELSRRLDTDYPLYRDITAPFLSGLAQVQFGLSLMSHAVAATSRRQTLLQGDMKNIRLEDILRTLVRFPIFTAVHPTCLDLAVSLTSDHYLAILRRILLNETGIEAEVVTAKYLSTVMRSALLLTKNHALTSGRLTTSTVSTLTRLFELYVSTWQKMEEDRKRKEEEEQSLYRYKTQSHGDDLTEEQKDELEIQRMFPSFEQEFEDLAVSVSLEETPRLEVTESEDSNSVQMKLTQDEMSEVSQVHQQLFAQLTTTAWYETTPLEHNTRPDHLQGLLGCYQVAAAVAKREADCLSYELDASITGAHLLVCSVLKNTMTEEDTVIQTKSTKPYDFYRDSNVGQVVQCRPLLERIRSRIEELLGEWADHPTLKELISIIERILSFSITHPLMKFVTGLELLLSKAQDWEANAAKFVSLREHLEAITEMIIQWRKLELGCWNCCLDNVVWRAEQQTAKWWFHLYQLIYSYLQHPAEHAQDEGEVEKSPECLSKALEEFMEGSTLGEFKTRLQLLKSFHCQLVHMDSSKEQDEAMRILWNVHQFYSQFVASVESDIARLRHPIEKQLKSFVKIARWNDINFYALKRAVEKTHRTLHKHSKLFDNALNQPAKPAFLEAGTEISDTALKTAALTAVNSQLQPHLFIVHNTQVCSWSITSLTLQEKTLQARLPALSQKVKKHCKQLITNCRHPHLNQALNDFTGDVIEAVHDLQSLNVTQSKDKDKQKAEAKLIHLRKRRALSDLFKQLQTLGLSYRKGLVALREVKDVRQSLMLIPPLDVAVLLSHRQKLSCDDCTVASWEGCQTYWTKCVARRALLHSSLQQPSKELGPGNIDRVKGFAEHLMKLLQTQWTDLANTTRQFANIRCQVENISRLEQTCVEPVCDIPDQGGVRHWLSTLKQVCDQSLEFAAQFDLLLQSCPNRPPDGSAYCTPLSAKSFPPVAKVTREDSDWSELLDMVKDFETSVADIRTKIDSELRLSLLLSWKQVDMLRSRYEKLSCLLPNLVTLEAHVCHGQDRSSLADSLVFIKSRLSETLTQFGQWESNSKPCDVNVADDDVMVAGVFTDVDALVTDVLLAVQSLIKTQQERMPSPDAADTEKTPGKDEEEKHSDEDGEEDSIEILEGHLTELLQKQLAIDIKELRIDSITRRLGQLVSRLSDSSSDCGQRFLIGNLLYRSQPILNQYCHLVQFYLTQAIGTHRNTGKLLAVLLSIFSELAQKGFCLPAEFSDELGGEGATDFENIEGGGLGEGEGVKDVSEQIESEDQLDEAKQQGEKPEEDKSNEPDIAPEDNAIEMSEDFEGQIQDLEATGDDKEGSDSEEEADENELDKQMGDVDAPEAEKLDEQIWGSDDEDDNAEEDQEKKEEFGAGSGPQSESQMVAKDDNKDDTEGKDKQTEESQEDKNNTDEPNVQDQVDEREYDENEIDPHYGQQETQEETENMELPDDLNLDSAEAAEEDETALDQEKGEEKSEDIDNMDTDKMEAAEEEGERQEEEPADEAETKEDKAVNEAESKEDEDESDKGRKEEAMDTDADQQEPDQVPGFQPQEDEKKEEPERMEEEPHDEDTPEASTEHAGKTSHETQNVQQSDKAKDQAGKNENDQEENEGAGMAETELEHGHEGDDSKTVTRGKSARRPQPGQSSEDRSVANAEEHVPKRLKTVDSNQSQDAPEQEESPDDDSGLFEHVRDAKSQSDAVTLDTATAEQQQIVPQQDEDEPMQDEEDGDVGAPPDDKPPQQDEEVEEVFAGKLKKSSQNQGKDDGESQEEMKDDKEPVDIAGERIDTLSVPRGPTSDIYTVMEHDTYNPGELDIDKLRTDLEQELHIWSSLKSGTPEQEKTAEDAWQGYEALTSVLSQELCEQLRLVLEPSQASKLRGDYRTGKRLNMRKVIPYIASEFRKDKIWLRRTKPSKRQYQVMLAIDDSSSMVDNHTKQLAFESLALISNALTLLEVGELSICSFGESVQVLHPFHEQFTSQSGGRILQQFTFEQQKTKIAQLLQAITGLMLRARSRQTGTSLETSQLLLVVSDGRGLFLEGMEVVKSAIRQAREAGVFIVFVVLDNPVNKDSILDIKLPVFKTPGQLPEIQTYMEHFPFPFYLLLRDINSLPQILSDALRQWFELVTAGDRC